MRGDESVGSEAEDLREQQRSLVLWGHAVVDVAAEHRIRINYDVKRGNIVIRAQKVKARRTALNAVTTL